MMTDSHQSRAPLGAAAVILSLMCLVCSVVAIAMSLKQWSLSGSELSYTDIQTLREDVWLGVCRQANPLVLGLASVFFFAAMIATLFDRQRSSMVASGLSSIALASAALLWMML